MPKQKRHKTKYPGVYWVQGTGANGKPERLYYIRYRKGGKEIDEKAGRQYRDNMTPARAARIRAERAGGKPSNKERREAKKAEELAARNKWTLNRLWERYKEDHDIKGLRVDQYRYDKYLEPVFGQKEPREIVALDVDRLRITMLKKLNLKSATVYNTLELLRRIVNFAVKKRLCPGFNFVVEMPKVDNEKTEDLTPEELERLVKAIDEDIHPQAGAMMKMVLFTGMRRGELFSLQWDHIDFERGFIHIKGPKGGVDQSIPLNDAARALLESYAKRPETPFVFPGRDGYQRKDIHHQVNRIKKAAELPKGFRALHGLRHTYASMLASSGKVDLYTLQKLLTHKSPVMTQRYAHLRDEALKKASALAGDIISDAIGEKEKQADNKKVVNMKNGKDE